MSEPRLLLLGLCALGACVPRPIPSLPVAAQAQAQPAAPPAAPVGVSVSLSTWDGEKEAPVLSTEKLPSGTRFALSIAVSRDAYVALYLADAKGGMRQLYPKHLADQRLLPANQWLRIPQSWFVLDQAVGIESFLLVAKDSKPESDERLRELAQVAHKDYPPEGSPLEMGANVRSERRPRRRPPPPGLMMGVLEEGAETLVESSAATVVRLSIRHVRR